MVHIKSLKSTYTALLLTLISSMLYAQDGYLTCTELESWPKEGSVNIPENHNRVSSYLFLLNKKKYLELFNAVNYNRSLARKAGLSKNDKLQYLYMGVDFSTPKGDSISVPLFLFDVNSETNVRKFEQYDGKLLENINANHMHADINGKYKVKAMLSRDSNGFWKDLVAITTDVAKSASKLMLGNPFGAADLLTCFQGRVSSGLDKLGTMSNDDDDDGKIEQEHSFLINLVKYDKSPEFREIVTSVRLYRVHWSFDRTRGKANYFEHIEESDYAGPDVFQDAVRNKTYPMILVVETRFAPNISTKEPEFTDEYQKEIDKEYIDFSESEQDMFKHYAKNFEKAHNIYNNLESYVYNIHKSNESLKASLLLEAVEDTYLYKQNVADENKLHKYTSSTTTSESRYANIGKRYEFINRKFERMYSENEYDESLVKSYQLIQALLNPIDGPNVSNETLYNQILQLNYYKDIAANLTPESYNTKKSYVRYQALLKTYETALVNKLINKTTENTEIAFYQKLMEKYGKCNSCVTECQEKIETLQKLQAELIECEEN